MDVSFVVIARNEAPRIARALRAIGNQDDLSDYEVIVVDDGSVDGTAAVVKSLESTLPAVRVVRHPVNMGRGAARATGVGAARGKYIAMVDADIVIPSQWWSCCKSYLGSYDAVCGVPVPDGDIAYIHERSRLVPKPTKPVARIAGSNAAFDGAVLRSVSFDSTLREGEDVALGHALEDAGYRTHTIERLVVEHREDKRLGEAISWLFVSGKGATRQMFRYRSLRLPDLAFGGFLADLVAAALCWRRLWEALVVLLAFPVLAASAHVSQRFQLDARRPARVAHGVLLDTLLLSVYFLGRTVGIASALGSSGRLASRPGRAGPEGLKAAR